MKTIKNKQQLDAVCVDVSLETIYVIIRGRWRHVNGNLSHVKI